MLKSFVAAAVATLKRQRKAVGVMVLILTVPLVQWILVTSYTGPGVVDQLPELPDARRTVEPYEGYGTWIDVYDYAPAFTSGEPALTPDDLPEMARLGVRTVYIQAAQLDALSPGLLVDPDLLGELLVTARSAGMNVVGWYLPRFADLDRDLAHLQAISDFEVDGHRFDGVAVDIEWRKGAPDHGERSRRLVELSRRLREATDGDALGAIVLTPVHLEVVNRDFWPGFPWEELAPYYDVWLPMGYWTERESASGLRDGYTYTADSVRRLRANIGDDDAPVHAIGGIGDGLTVEDVDRFALALDEVGALGWSIYDWRTLSPEMRKQLTARL